MPWAGFVKPYNKMSTFKERLQVEKAELSEKLEKLREFIASENFAKIDPVQMTLLNIQVKAMETYSQCLLERIIRLDVE
jgi:hypothetical protein